MEWVIYMWPWSKPDETWDEVQTFEADSYEVAMERFKGSEPDQGRYMITPTQSLDHGQYLRVDADGTVEPVDTF